MNRCHQFLVVIAALLLPFSQANAIVIHESATLGTIGESGTGFILDDEAWLASRFSVSQTTSVTQIGGHLWSNQFGSANNLFGAIVELQSSTDTPGTKAILQSNIVASTNFKASSPSTDFRTSLLTTLTPGDYALVFGGDLTGLFDFGSMPINNSDLPSSSYFFCSQDGSCKDASENPSVTPLADLRFVVEGTVVPIPPAIWLFGSGLFGLIGIARKKAA